MRKSDIVSEIQVLAGSKKMAEEILNAVFEKIRTALAAGEPVDINGFGKFEVIGKKERPGRNPVTGEPLTIPAKKAVKFKPAKNLKESVDK